MAHDGCEQVIEVVGDPSRQLADGVHLLGLAELFFPLPQSVLGLLPAGDFMMKLHGSRLHALLQLAMGLMKVRVSRLNLCQHLVESIGQYADLIIAPLFDPN